VSYADKVLRCRDCGNDFIFTTGEQEFYALKGLTNEPGRCPECRAARRADRANGSGEFRPRRELHIATCAQCGGEARVPFVPRGDRPVYCSNCYEQVRVQ
jgi:CxxC-x17-CxxC domain-containing protein